MNAHPHQTTPHCCQSSPPDVVYIKPKCYVHQVVRVFFMPLFIQPSIHLVAAELVKDDPTPSHTALFWLENTVQELRAGCRIAAWYFPSTAPPPPPRCARQAKPSQAKARHGWHGMAWFWMVCLRHIVGFVILEAALSKIVARCMSQICVTCRVRNGCTWCGMRAECVYGVQNEGKIGLHGME